MLSAGCGQPLQKPAVTTLTFEPKQKKEASPEEKKKLQLELSAAAEKTAYTQFAELLKKVYDNGWQGEEDFKKIESKLYVDATTVFTNGETQKALDTANTIYSRVFESWRFKYLKVRALEKLGKDAYDAGNLDKAQSYAQQIMSIEFRPEGVNLMARIYIKQAEDLIKAGDRVKAKSILMQSSGMEIATELRQKIDEMLKGL